MASSRTLKQSIIAAGYIVFLSTIFFGVYDLFIRVAPTCSDGKQNQNEAGIDCGGICAMQCEPPLNAKDIITREAAFVFTGTNSYDVLAKIYNPNDIAGASQFSYTLALRDAAGTLLAKQSGTSFILPQETKYLFEFHLATPVRPTQATLEISQVSWERFRGYTERPRVMVVQQAYNRIQSGPGYGAATGLVVNESPYDFRSLLVKVVLRDASGKPLAINSTEMSTMPSKGQRDFRLVWPTIFPGEVKNVEMLVDADIYHSENFIKQSSSTTPF
ncbi:MAG: hypothetical protein KBC83_02435 [Candidatus Moranbacteria bacterium]|nr:hypothetical protein [Candidatus Moranbacteria bacterium]MBP9801504.1 hypothetical protein [Candidatus Moranbacteria bacterium]